MGMMGAAARKRDKALVNPEMYQPMFGADSGMRETRPFDEQIPMPQGLGAAMDIPQMKKPGLFGSGSKVWDVIGAAGDALAAYGGMPRNYAHQKALERKEAADREEFERLRESKFGDWKRQYDYQLANPEPKQPSDDQFSRALAAAGILPGTPEYAKLNRERALALTTRVVMTPQGPMMIGGGYGYPGGAPSAPMPQPGAIVDDPRKAGGAGSTQRPFDAVIQQESGGRAGVIGPQTPYGRAQGLSQMLPATAQEQAKKLGIAWRPEMMTGTSPEAAAYQRQLGESYFNEGLERTGNLRDALRYYHGGPNRGLWGRKTNKYADAVMARIGG